MKFELIKDGGTYTGDIYRAKTETLHIEYGYGITSSDIDALWDGYEDVCRGEDGKLYWVMRTWKGDHSGEYAMWVEIEECGAA